MTSILSWQNGRTSTLTVTTTVQLQTYTLTTNPAPRPRHFFYEIKQLKKNLKKSNCCGLEMGICIHTYVNTNKKAITPILEA